MILNETRKTGIVRECVVMTPGWDNANGVTGWTRNCNIQSDSALQQACEDVFRFDDAN
ncbi:hypothetical protein MC04F15_16360 [Escherichia coli]|nr:prepilin peptidase [Escherichia coli]